MSHYEEAIKRAQLATEGRLRYPKADSLAVIAMSQFKLKQADEARVTLAACDKMFEEKIPKLDEDPGDEWHDWIIVRASLLEAKRMIDGEAASAAPPADLLR